MIGTVLDIKLVHTVCVHPTQGVHDLKRKGVYDHKHEGVHVLHEGMLMFSIVHNHKHEGVYLLLAEFVYHPP